MKRIILGLLLTSLSPLCLSADTAPVYTMKQLEAAEVAGVHFGDNPDDALRAMAEYFAIEQDRVKRVVDTQYKEYIDEHVRFLKYGPREKDYEISVSFSMDLDRAATGYLAVSSITWSPDNAEGYERLQSIVDEHIVKTIELVGPATFVKRETDTEIPYDKYTWCTKLRDSGKHCAKNSPSIVMSYRIDLTHVGLWRKFDTYYYEKKKK